VFGQQRRVSGRGRGDINVEMVVVEAAEGDDEQRGADNVLGELAAQKGAEDASSTVPWTATPRPPRPQTREASPTSREEEEEEEER